MTNNDEGKMNTKENTSLLSYTNGTSDNADNSSASASERSETPTTDSPAPVQFQSRRARRMSETSMMSVVPPASVVPSIVPQVPKIPSLSTLSATPKKVVETEVEDTTVDSEKNDDVVEVSAPETSENTDNTVVEEAETKVAEPVAAPVAVPAISTKDYLKEQLAAHHPKNNKAALLRSPKDYWGGTAMLTSLSVFLLTQVVFVIVLVGYVMVQGLMTDIQAAPSIETALSDLVMEEPILLILSSLMMYAAWLGCMWWVTKYRSGVQAGKKFWSAFKDNFRLNNFKKRDIAYGAGLAAGLLGFQHVVLNVLPTVFPVLKDVFAGSDNTTSFQALDGIWFYVVAFAIGSLIGPISEELFFRGFLMRGFENHYSYKNRGRNMDMLEDGVGSQAVGLKSMFVAIRSITHKYRYVLALIMSSILFGMMHFAGSWVTVAMTGLLGLVFGIVTLKLNRLYPAIFGHIFHNAAVFTVVALSR